MKRIILFSALLFTALVALTVTEGRLYAMRVYGAPCGQASGFAGFLQQTHFLPKADCALNPKNASAGPCASPGAVCTYKNPVSGGTTGGHCAPQGSTCVCSIP